MRWLRGVVDACLRDGATPNHHTITIENVCRRGEGVTREQVAANLRITRYCRLVYGFPAGRGRQLRHSDINPKTRPYCPGDDIDLRSLIIASGGDPTDTEV
jgi:hypothetical protein